MRKYISILLLAFGISVQAQTTLTETVKNLNGKLVCETNVVVKGQPVGAISAKHGSFKISNFPKQSIALALCFSGLKSQKKKGCLNNRNITVNFLFEKNSESLVEIVSTPTTSKKSQQASPLPITYFGIEEIVKPSISGFPTKGHQLRTHIKNIVAHSLLTLYRATSKGGRLSIVYKPILEESTHFKTKIASRLKSQYRLNT